MPHVFHGAMIAFFESFAEFATGIAVFHRWVLVNLVIVSIGMTSIPKVAASSFHAFMKSAALSVSIRIRRAVPVAILILILCSRGDWLCFVSAGFHRCGSGDAEGKCRN
jgi:hypothetical protein